MLTTRTYGSLLLAGLALALGTAATRAEAAAPATTTPDLTTVTDDTGTISIGLPADWTATSTSPGLFSGFYDAVPPGMYPTLMIDAPYQPEVQVSGLAVQALPIANHDDVIEAYFGDFGVGCPEASFARSPFSGSGLTGVRVDYGQCYDYVARHTVVADLGTAMTVVVDFFATTAEDDALFPQMLASLALPTGELPVIGLPASFFEFGTFESMPQLGTEPVRGTGCGADGSIGDQIPDGWWSGYARIEPVGSAVGVDIDLACVYYGASAQRVLADGDDNVVEADPDFLVVNNNTRERTMPAAINLSYFEGAQLPDACIPGDPGDQFTDQSPLAWIHIADRQVDYIFYRCTGAPTAGATP